MDSNLNYWRERARDTFASWRAMFSFRTLPTDLAAGVTVAFVALPLNLALAIACGVPPEIGLITAVLAGVVAGLTGGSQLQVSGPAAAMVPLVGEIIARHGMDGLIVATLLAGLVQILLGLWRIGRFVQAIPVSVVSGFITGIGLLIIGGQLPRLLGLPEATKSVADMVRDLSWTQHVDWVSAALGAGVLILVVLLPRLSRRLPAALIALAIASAIVYAAGLDVSKVGAIPGAFPPPQLPPFFDVHIVRLLPEAMAMAALMSIESLLSAVVVDSMAALPRHSANQELVGQGLANVVSSFFRCLPVTGVIVRSSVAVQSGGRTRLVSLTHSLALLLMMLVAGPVVAEVPRAALAGILLAVGLRLTEIRELVHMWRISRFEAGIFVATAAGIVLTDFIVGVAVGLVLALVHFTHTHRQLGLSVTTRVVDEPGEVERLLALRNQGSKDGRPLEVAVLRIDGPIFFASHSHLEELLAAKQHPHYLIIDLAGVPHIDLTGIDSLRSLIVELDKRGTKVLLARAVELVEQRLDSSAVTALCVGSMVHPSIGWAMRTIGQHEYLEDNPAPAAPG